MMRSTKFLVRIAGLLDVGIEVRTVRRRRHEASMNSRGNAGVAVKPSIQKLDLKGASVRVVTDGAKVAGGNGRSIHGDASLVVMSRAN
jgi:hypothetical protein